MEFLKNKSEIVTGQIGSIHESVYKMGDMFKVRTVIDIPKSLINAFVSKAKKEHGIDAKENWSDIELAEMFVKYITTNFMNVESLPVNAILGDIPENEVSTEIQQEEPVQPQSQPEEPVQTEFTTEVQPEEAQAQAQAEI